MSATMGKKEKEKIK